MELNSDNSSLVLFSVSPLFSPFNMLDLPVKRPSASPSIIETSGTQAQHSPPFELVANRFLSLGTARQARLAAITLFIACQWVFYCELHTAEKRECMIGIARGREREKETNTRRVLTHKKAHTFGGWKHFLNPAKKSDKKNSPTILSVSF